MADDRLDEQPGQRRRDPQARQSLDILAERLEDAAHIGVLEREADLEAEEAEADVPQAGETLSRLLHRGSPPCGRRGGSRFARTVPSGGGEIGREHVALQSLMRNS